ANAVVLAFVRDLALLIEAAKQAFKTRLPSSQTRCWHPRKHILVVHRTTSSDVYGIVVSLTGTMPALGSCSQLVQGAGRCFCSRAHSKPARRALLRQPGSCSAPSLALPTRRTRQDGCRAHHALKTRARSDTGPLARDLPAYPTRPPRACAMGRSRLCWTCSSGSHSSSRSLCRSASVLASAGFAVAGLSCCAPSPRC